MSVFGVILVRILPHSDWTGKDTSYLFAFSPNAENTGQNNSEYGHFSRSFFLLYMEYPIGVNWNFLFQILHITRLFPSPSPPFYIWSSLTSHQIQWDIRIPFFIFCFENSKRSSYYWKTKEMPHGKKVLCDIHTLEMLKTVKSYFH